MSIITIDSSDLRNHIMDVLEEIGIPQHLKGYDYLVYAIELSVSDRDQYKHITESLYPAVAENFDATRANVERCIRHCIKSLSNARDVAPIKKYFGNSLDYDSVDISNAQFIITLSNKIARSYKG